MSAFAPGWALGSKDENRKDYQIMAKLTGNTLEGCVRQVAEGKVPESDVAKIRSRTTARTDDEFEQIVQAYEKMGWRNLPDAGKIAWRLWRAGKIDQPLLRGEEPLPGGAVWVDETGSDTRAE